MIVENQNYLTRGLFYFVLWMIKIWFAAIYSLRKMLYIYIKKQKQKYSLLSNNLGACSFIQQEYFSFKKIT